MRRIWTIGAVLAAGLLALAGCQRERLASQWRVDAIVIDGDDTEWLHVSRIALDKGTAIALQHDSASLYLLFKTQDQTLLPKIAARGLQLWLDPYGRKARTFGVRFPASLRQDAAPPAPGPAAADTSGFRAGRFDPGMVVRTLGESRRHLIITGPERGECCTLSVAQADSYGVRAGAAYERGILVCELQLPLREDRLHPYAAAVAGRDSVVLLGIGLETGGERDGGPAGQRPHFTGGGIGSGGKVQPYDQETMDHRDEFRSPTRLDFWGTVELRFPPGQP